MIILRHIDQENCLLEKYTNEDAKKKKLSVNLIQTACLKDP
ncbi:hypothetical protein ACIAD1254 [Acinetobacter baylyi ADP1]|uniref:Uncharacterized protein n=1 Tax=Acinetobacter baylyi (strain ATCC 33305 / BD413 / ADP1) TaxID=62977 RepID=Q6FCT1_ACIAD|nr:hypothetical protein ACIAD1254 [Acinetobacter baylyi ADP1]